MQKMVCPHCDERLAYHKTKGTHIWSCTECPYVSLEFYETKDLINLATYLEVALTKSNL